MSSFLRCVFVLSVATTFTSGRVNAAGYSAIYVFGVDLSDVGNTYALDPARLPDPPYWNGRHSNGKVFCEVVADSLGLGPLLHSLAGGTDYARGGIGALVWAPDDASLNNQVRRYKSSLGGGSADPNALYLISGGWREIIAAVRVELGDPFSAGDHNPARSERTSGEAATNLAARISELADVGARHFAVLGMIDVGVYLLWKEPGYTAIHARRATVLSEHFDSALTNVMARYEGLDVTYVDRSEWLKEAKQELGEAKLWFTGDAYYAFPSAAAHQILAEDVLEALGNHPPAAARTLPDLTLVLDQDARRVVPAFSDEEGDSLSYVAVSSDTTVATASIADGQVHISPVRLGVSTITLIAFDGYHFARIAFDAEVRRLGYTVLLDLNPADGNQATGSLSSVAADGALTVQVYLQDIGGSAGFRTQIEYDSSQLTFDRFDSGDLFPSVDVQENEDGLTLTTGTLEEGTVEESGLVATLHFRATAMFSGGSVRPIDARLLREGEEEPPERAVTARVSGRSCDYDDDGRVAFSDFLIFVESYGTRLGDGKYGTAYDLDGNERIDFADFLIFVQEFGSRAAQVLPSD